MITAKAGTLLRATNNISVFMVYSFKDDGSLACKILDKGVDILPGDFGVALQESKKNSCALVLHCKSGMIVNGGIKKPCNLDPANILGLSFFEEVEADGVE